MTAIVSISCMLFGVWLCYKAVISYYEMQNKEKYGTRTMAEIIDVIKEENHDAEMGTYYSYWPIYEYTDIYGSLIQHRPSSTTGLEEYRVGDKVEIAYLPDEEGDILVLNQKGKWKDVLGYVTSGVFTFLIGLGVFMHNGLHKFFI